MKFTAHIVIERPIEHVFRWMFQPHQLVQLITRDPNNDIIRNGDIPPELIERINKLRLPARAETDIEIDDLSTPTLQVGSTFHYMRREKEKDWSKASPMEGYPGSRGAITITQSVPPTFFAFTSTGFFSTAHHLGFQVQQERTSMTYTQSFPTLPFMLTSAMAGKFASSEVVPRGLVAVVIIAANEVVPVLKGVTPFGNEFVRQQLLHLKAQMETEIA